MQQVVRIGIYMDKSICQKNRQLSGNFHTLQETNISHLGERKIILKRDLGGDMLVSQEGMKFSILNQKKDGVSENQPNTPDSIYRPI